MTSDPPICEACGVRAVGVQSIYPRMCDDCGLAWWRARYWPDPERPTARSQAADREWERRQAGRQ